MSDEYEVREGKVELKAAGPKKTKFTVGGKTVGAWNTNRDGAPGKEYSELQAIAAAGGYARVEVSPYHGTFQGSPYTSYDVVRVIPIDAPAGAPVAAAGSSGGGYGNTLEIRAAVAQKNAVILCAAGRISIDQINTVAAGFFLGLESLAAPDVGRPDGWASDTPSGPAPEEKSDVPF